ncbi:MAG TPA: PKD domain-containing protein [Thermoanaerobaculia bacterium]|nr:PKD domain-containing protein [Thermoanaerobaculia bacterium]
MSASPARIDTTNGTTTVIATVLRPNGQPTNPGTQVRFSTNLGVIDEVVETDSSGAARATLRGDGRFGTAKVRATTGNITTPVELDVEIGRAARSVTLQANPTNLPATGGRVNLIAVVRDSQGQGLAGVPVNFQTELGVLGSRGSLLQTNAAGEARDTVTVSEAEIANTDSTEFTVTVQATGNEGGLISQTFRVRIQSQRPEADFTVQTAGGLRVSFQSTSTGQEPLTFEWDFGDSSGDVEEADDRNPVHEYLAANTYTVTLSVTNSFGSDVVVKRVRVENGRAEIVTQ